MRTLFVLVVLLASAACAETHARPYDQYFNHYADSFVTKAFVKYGGPTGNVTEPELRLDQVREFIRNAWEITGGMHQIVYLVGATDRGLDSGYPCNTNFNAACRSELSEDPLTAIRLAMREAKTKYNCDLSFHFNTSDAHEDSLDWQECLDRDVLARDKDGMIKTCGFWRHISHAKDWKSGFAKKRIDATLKAIPELLDAKTIHYDALFARTSEKEGITLDDDKAGIRAIVDYWHEKGIDVTTEFITSTDMLGYFPMVWHNNLDEHQRVKYPIDLVCGGDDEWNGRWRNDYFDCIPIRAGAPAAGCLYEEAWGLGHWGDLHPQDLDRSRMICQLFKTAILFAWYNRNKVVGHSFTANRYVVRRTGGVVATVNTADRRLTVYEKDRLVVDGTDYFLDMPHGVLLVHSLKGCDRTFVLPDSLKTVSSFSGVKHPARESVVLANEGGRLRIMLNAGESLVLK